jgi:hypothetical protein
MGRDASPPVLMTIVQGQQRVFAERNDQGLLFIIEHRRARFARPHLRIRYRCALAPFGDRLRVDAIAPGKGPYALLTMLYRSTDRLRRAGAAV